MKRNIISGALRSLLALVIFAVFAGMATAQQFCLGAYNGEVNYRFLDGGKVVGTTASIFATTTGGIAIQGDLSTSHLAGCHSFIYNVEAAGGVTVPLSDQQWQNVIDFWRGGGSVLLNLTGSGTAMRAESIRVASKFGFTMFNGQMNGLGDVVYEDLGTNPFYDESFSYVRMASNGRFTSLAPGAHSWGWRGNTSNVALAGFLPGEVTSTSGLFAISLDNTLFDSARAGTNYVQAFHENWWESASAVPEPGTLIALAAGLGCLAKRRRKG